MNETTLDVIVTGRSEQADGVVVLDLASTKGEPLPAFEPGAHVELHLPGDFVRQYSLCGDPSDRSRYRLGVLLDPQSRGGSVAVHATAKPGETLRISLPRNLFPMLDGVPHNVFVGGGIGVTPLIAMAYHSASQGTPFTLHYSAKSRSKAAFLDELSAPPFAGHVDLHLSEDGADKRFSAARDLPQPSGGAHLYVCGPTHFMDHVIAEAKALGYEDARIHREYFGAETDISGDAFEVFLSRSNKTIAVPSGVPITKALAEAGIRVQVSCEQGVCGTCLCEVLEGEPDHRDNYLTDEEKAANDQILLCCSRAKTPRLVLDL